mmetsp:Transcript_15568/g.37107  ORF Transcript_15568/g.37107 Transcript_15568/m.37107 type:complete len:178 (-) Transcript_15568:342-875(-)
MRLMTFAVVAALSLVAAATAAVSSSASPSAFLTPLAQRGGITAKPNGRLRMRQHPLHAVTQRFTLERGAEAFDDISAIAKRIKGKVGPPPTDEELLQWLADTEAILIQIMQGKRPPGSDRDAETFVVGVSAFYMNCLIKCGKRELDYSFRPKVAAFAWDTTDPLATAIENRLKPRVD